MTGVQQQALLVAAKTAEGAGKFEPFKTTQIFDGTALNPKWMG